MTLIKLIIKLFTIKFTTDQAIDKL